MIHQIATEGPTRVVDAGTLHELTREGWLLLAVLEHEELVPVDEPIPVPEAQFERTKNGGSYSGTSPVTWRKQVLVRSQRFLVRQPVDAALADAQKRLADANDLLSLIQATKHGLANEKHVLTEKLADYDQRLTKSNQDYNRVHGMYQNAADRSRALEGDIGKIRTAIGDLRMREILEGKA